MSFEQLLAKQKLLDELNLRFGPLFGAEMEMLRRQHGIEDANKLSAVLDEVENTDRTLRIGVVGRMKAGKSSLLNALFFEGDSVLPKAATPMTAALTTISWGEKVSAEIEFYSREDRDDISHKASEYQRQWQSLVDGKKKNLLQKLRDKLQQKALVDVPADELNDDEIKNIELSAEKAATLEMKKQARLHAAFDQFERMQGAPIRMDASEEGQIIEAEDLDSLKSLLTEYVSAHGRFMPFCKSVHIKLPLDSLQGLEVVDTPGFNDPVVSREERTNEILGHCDVVLIVSPSGRLLTAEDMTLMGRITQKEGVHELYVVVSQTDMQLYGSERRNSIDESLSVIQAKNAIRAEQVFDAYCESEPEARGVFSQILNDADNRVICVSGMAAAISQRIQQKKSLDPDQENTVRMLKQFYLGDISAKDNDDFSTLMAKISGIDAVRDILESANSRKEDILENRKLKLADTKGLAIQSFSKSVIDFGKNRVQELERTDVQELYAEIAHLEKMKESLALEINNDFRDHRISLPITVRGKLRSVLRTSFQIAESGVDDSEDRKSESVTEDKSGALPWLARKLGVGGTKTINNKVITVSTSRASKSLSQFITNVADDLEDAFNREREGWRKSVHQSIAKSYRSIVGDEGVDKNMVLRSISHLVENLELGNFEISRHLPSGLGARGTLEGSEAKEYLDMARDFISELHGEVDELISNCVDNIETSLPNDVAANFYKGLEQQVLLLEEQIVNKQESLSRFASLDQHYSELVK